MSLQRMQANTLLKIYGRLFEELHLSGIWKDGKQISDAIPLHSPKVILEEYKKEKDAPNFDLNSFFNNHFRLQKPQDSTFQSDLTKSAEQHIYSLWEVLERTADTDIEGSSLVPLPHAYVVPGGRFNEIYYWDSYFTMLGLTIHNRVELVESMVDNFAWLIEKYGFIPNGNRTYFLGRSQPPFFAQMVEHLSSINGLSVLTKYKSAMIMEYEFWMDESEYAGHKVELEDGFLNKYFDQNPAPREEMYADDSHLVAKSDRESKDLFKHIRAACESGWDFSSRWLEDQNDLGSIRCGDILPVDLNCLLYSLEVLLAKTVALEGKNELMEFYSDRAESRRQLIQKYFWNESSGHFVDYDYVKQEQVEQLHAATVLPLYFNLATNAQAQKVSQNIKEQLLRPGGVVTTTINSGQQWDAPNGWAPLQWLTVIGLDNYGHKTLSKEIAERWIGLNERVYKSTGKFVEKYNVEDMTLDAGGGEYPVQDGFGWSNGVYLALKNYIDSND